MRTLGFVIAGWIGWTLWAGLVWAGVIWSAENTRIPAGALTVLRVVASVFLPLALIVGVVL